MLRRMIHRLSLPSLSKPQAQVGLAPLFRRLRTAHGCTITQVNRIFQNHVALSSSRKLQCGLTFSTSGDFSAKKCVPCDAKDLRPMTEETANELISKVPKWNLVNENGVLKLNRSWKVKTFLKGLELFRLVAEVAESEGHHPDLHLVGWNNVTIEIWTHAVGGLTENDFILAAKINGLPLQDLLRRKAKN
ncbi:pterin-4-alpha-carbinolamine dehydratase 2, mitochondrial isoform X1 [Syzygium oleosum]|uniref:pterin-4-alpha-carbinolamine dehydratase 2, mitochondrial isoform X1 n=1 Tax=Syzygium oleosum TaxID=219896 RepID=UPI0024BA8BDF|nr:pterin-4-alpha-carbinolamine dehydratase 2, mitochondrial isoform X1 [Syzygium oleosum]